MNNNRGWGLRNELWICFAMILFFAVAVILINKVFTSMDDSSIVKKNDEINEEVIKKDDDISSNIDNNKSEIKEVEQEKNVNVVNYSILEDKLVGAGSKYANKYLTNENNDSVKVVTVVRLQTESLLDTLKINDVECSGYIKIEKSNDNFKYYPYLSCGSVYQTTDYDVNFDNTDL